MHIVFDLFETEQAPEYYFYDYPQSMQFLILTFL